MFKAKDPREEEFLRLIQADKVPKTNTKAPILNTNINTNGGLNSTAKRNPVATHSSTAGKSPEPWAKALLGLTNGMGGLLDDFKLNGSNKTKTMDEYKRQQDLKNSDFAEASKRLNSIMPIMNTGIFNKSSLTAPVLNTVKPVASAPQPYSKKNTEQLQKDLKNIADSVPKQWGDHNEVVSGLVSNLVNEKYKPQGSKPSNGTNLPILFGQTNNAGLKVQLLPGRDPSDYSSYVVMQPGKNSNTVGYAFEQGIRGGKRLDQYLGIEKQKEHDVIIKK